MQVLDPFPWVIYCVHSAFSVRLLEQNFIEH